MNSEKMIRISIYFSVTSLVILLSSFIFIEMQLVKIETKTNNELEAQKLHVFAIEKKMPFISRYLSVVSKLEEAAGKKMSAREVVNVATVIVEMCEQNKDIDLTEDIVFGVIERESGFDPKSVSPKKAYGLMQLLFSTALIHSDALGHPNLTVDLLMNPSVNVSIGISELCRLRKQFLSFGISEWSSCLSAYYWGERPVFNLIFGKEMGTYPSLEYGHGVMKLAKKWRENGL